MSYRNGTYIAFHANGTNIPINSDIKYYNMIKAWCGKNDDSFSIINSHDKTYAVRDTSSKETLKRRLKERLNNSKNMLLIIGDTTKDDKDWIPFEIEYAVDICKIPLIITYTKDYSYILNPNALSHLWPEALRIRVQNETAHAIHIPFKKDPIRSAIDQFNHNVFPLGGGLGYYSQEAYRQWGLL